MFQYFPGNYMWSLSVMRCLASGGFQTLSRTLKEEVRFSSKEILTLDWASYPILRFSECPSEVTTSLISRPDKAPVGAGEPTALTIAHAVGNAIFHATGVRIRKTPFTAQQFKASQSS
ncbi:CO/xanthine dehydrogenase Mo-binding subunit [Paraburkholderia sp. GAS448]|uniref:hypothetical protein n=1 Tax=Paraburkholderia sp. GAS448 TaxID=3035136 RepID=UPI003D230F14